MSAKKKSEKPGLPLDNVGESIDRTEDYVARMGSILKAVEEMAYEVDTPDLARRSIFLTVLNALAVQGQVLADAAKNEIESAELYRVQAKGGAAWVKIGAKADKPAP